MGLDITAYSNLTYVGHHEEWPDEDAHYEQHEEAYAYLAFPHALLRRRPVTAPTDLTAREMQVLRLMAKGLGGHQIAAELGVKFATVAKIRFAMYPKLGARNAAHAVAIGYQRGFLVADADSAGLAEASALAAALRQAGYRLTRAGAR